MRNIGRKFDAVDFFVNNLFGRQQLDNKVISHGSILQDISMTCSAIGNVNEDQAEEYAEIVKTKLVTGESTFSSTFSSGYFVNRYHFLAYKIRERTEKAFSISAYFPRYKIFEEIF